MFIISLHIIEPVVNKKKYREKKLNIVVLCVIRKMYFVKHFMCACILIYLSL